MKRIIARMARDQDELFFKLPSDSESVTRPLRALSQEECEMRYGLGTGFAKSFRALSLVNREFRAIAVEFLFTVRSLVLLPSETDLLVVLPFPLSLLLPRLRHLRLDFDRFTRDLIADEFRAACEEERVELVMGRTSKMWVGRNDGRDQGVLDEWRDDAVELVERVQVAAGRHAKERDQGKADVLQKALDGSRTLLKMELE